MKASDVLPANFARKTGCTPACQLSFVDDKYGHVAAIHRGKKFAMPHNSKNAFTALINNLIDWHGNNGA